MRGTGEAVRTGSSSSQADGPWPTQYSYAASPVCGSLQVIEVPTSSRLVIVAAVTLTWHTGGVVSTLVAAVSETAPRFPARSRAATRKVYSRSSGALNTADELP